MLGQLALLGVRGQLERTVAGAVFAGDAGTARFKSIRKKPNVRSGDVKDALRSHDCWLERNLLSLIVQLAESGGQQMTQENGVLGSLFVPEIMTPAQFYDGRRQENDEFTPIKRLMMAILEDALRCFQNNAGATSGRRKRLFLEAEEWLCGTGGEGPFSFNMVCEALGIEPEFLRNELLRWRAGTAERGDSASARTALPGRQTAPD